MAEGGERLESGSCFVLKASATHSSERPTLEFKHKHCCKKYMLRFEVPTFQLSNPSFFALKTLCVVLPSFNPTIHSPTAPLQEVRLEP